MSEQAPCRFLEWDTAFFGLRIARIDSSHLTDTALPEALAWSSEQRIQCLYFLCAADDDVSVRLAETHGFHLVDLRVSLLWRRADESAPAAAQASETIIRPLEVQDTAAIEGIASTAYQDTRFYYDRHFGPDRATALYREWARKSCNGGADAIFVAQRGHKVGGFITCHVQSPQRGQIGLVGVDDAMRGAGLGRLLVGAALAYFSDRGVGAVEVVTQGRNVAAQRLYQKCGFRTDSLYLWYHKWFGGMDRYD